MDGIFPNIDELARVLCKAGLRAKMSYPLFLRAEQWPSTNVNHENSTEHILYSRNKQLFKKFTWI